MEWGENGCVEWGGGERVGRVGGERVVWDENRWVGWSGIRTSGWGGMRTSGVVVVMWDVRSWLRAREWLCGCVNRLMVVCTGY